VDDIAPAFFGQRQIVFLARVNLGERGSPLLSAESLRGHSRLDQTAGRQVVPSPVWWATT
jgi:hypothetical protein